MISSRLIQNLVFLCLLLLFSLSGCSGDNSVSSIGNLELSDTNWGAVEIQGAINADGSPRKVDASTSTWSFESDGRYSWFLFAPPFFDLSGSGRYALSGDTMTVSGIIANTLIGDIPQSFLIITATESTFSFRDDGGDRWTYERID